MKDLKNFLDEAGKLTKYPAKRPMKFLALEYLAGKFEKGKRYTEREVNDLLNQWHLFGDPATLRRELYDYPAGSNPSRGVIAFTTPSRRKDRRFFLQPIGRAVLGPVEKPVALFPTN